MGIHHVAIATRDIEATHTFYTDVMGFELVKVVAAPTPEGGWAKHAFYDTGGNGLIAFWDIHDDGLAEFDPAIATGLGLPPWANHLAFNAPTLPALEARKRHILSTGHDVAEVDHGWCHSIYVTDPNGIMVEFCTTTKRLDERDRVDAHRILMDDRPDLEVAPTPAFFRGATVQSPA